MCMKFLVDENLSKSKKFLEEHKNFENVKDIIGKGVSDEKIIKYAKEHDYVIHTKDKRCALHGLIEGIPVWHIDQKTGKSVKLKAQELSCT